AVTSAGGSASIVADNLSQDSIVATGDADSSNPSAAFVGLDGCFNGDTTLTADVSASCPTSAGAGSGVVPEAVCQNAQDGSNRANSEERRAGNTGDGVAGQVIGAVTHGGESIDEPNRSVTEQATSGT